MTYRPGSSSVTPAVPVVSSRYTCFDGPEMLPSGASTPSDATCRSCVSAPGFTATGIRSVLLANELGWRVSTGPAGAVSAMPALIATA